MIKQGEWDTSQFSELKQDLLEKLNIEHDPITNEIVMQKLITNEEKLTEMQNAFVTNEKKLIEIQNTNEQRLIEMQNTNEQKLTEIQDALIAMKKLIEMQNASITN